MGTAATKSKARAKPTPPSLTRSRLRQVHKFNGTPVRNLKHLAELVAASTDPFLRFELEYNEVRW